MTNSELLQYCREHIEDFERMESEALEAIDHLRCPLYHAHQKLYDKMYEVLEENGFDIEDIDIEAVFWGEDE